jgi:hypothetical protein
MVETVQTFLAVPVMRDFTMGDFLWSCVFTVVLCFVLWQIIKEKK